MERPKKTEESVETPYFVRVLDGNTVKLIDANKEKNWMLKYKHVSGSNFHF